VILVLLLLFQSFALPLKLSFKLSNVHFFFYILILVVKGEKVEEMKKVKEEKGLHMAEVE
jgi:hypothetical protein